MRAMQRKTILGGGILVIEALLVVALWGQVLKGSASSVSFFDIGQGDASFIETSFGRQILIDGGPSNAVLGKLDQRMPRWDKTIDLVIATHPDSDHITGLIGVLKKYKAGIVLWNGIEKDSALYREWRKALKEEEAEGAMIVIAKAPQRIVLSNKGCPQFLDIFSPFEDIAGQKFADDNDTSIVARLVSCKHSVLFTGDLTLKGEKKLLEKGFSVDSDILKAGHHGSKTSSSSEFVQATSPDIAVISSGKNNQYGHPHEETLATLEQFGITVMRTDTKGDITLYFNN
ncbi:MAG: MBL fold metallo-hydrolase [Candidatus Wildermuthbacteria bacterium]|nr:MBL fold metallo-hydrolase [Candidatus Wildermuthbacteria bacterium]